MLFQNMARCARRMAVLCAAVYGVLAVGAQAEVRLPAVFGPHMVLQQDKPLTVWGWAQPGEAVSVELAGSTAKATANDKGEWRVNLPAQKQGTGLIMTVSGTNTLRIDDVLVGEVWLCSGQSNMEFTVERSVNGPAEVAAANFPQIRLFHIPKRPAPMPERDVDAKWEVCSPETVKTFAAAGYYFAREIQKELKVPVGLIEAAWGGTRIEPWTAPEGFGLSPALKELNAKVLMTLPGQPQHDQRVQQLLSETEQWVAAARKSVAEKQPMPAMPVFPPELVAPTDRQDPVGLYNGMVYAVVPFALRGALWYQGEANHAEKDYTEKMRALIEGWRKVWGDPEISFYYVQIAPFKYGSEPYNVLPEFWEQQTAALAIPNTGMVVTNDIMTLNDIHPPNKQEVGRRLALIALAKNYGKSGLVYAGPTFKSMTPEEGKLRVTFDNIADGLKTRDGQAPSCFEIIDGAKGGFVKATAVIDGASVVLSSPEAPAPVAMRFAWNKTTEPNLQNSAGLPASAFRAGKMPAGRDRLTVDVPEAEQFKLVYDLDLGTVGPTISYRVDNRAQITQPFDRIAYFVELGANEQSSNYVWVSVDAFTSDLSKIGVPTFESGAFFQQELSAMNVLSNAPGVVNGSRLKGNIEFWPNSYTGVNSKAIPDASPKVFDFGDMPVGNGPVAGHGSMQIHNPGAKQTLFALNDWRHGATAGLGIGNSPKGNPDWTFEKNAKSYAYKRLRVFVHPKQ